MLTFVCEGQAKKDMRKLYIHVLSMFTLSTNDVYRVCWCVHVYMCVWSSKLSIGPSDLFILIYFIITHRNLITSQS